MIAYENLAEIYDTFMDDVPYEKWSNQIVKWLHEYEIENGLVLDLGCGTGTMTEALASNGYNMMGLDVSEDMLAVAQNKMQRLGNDILYLNQDMRELELLGNVRVVVSVCDVVNYILEPRELSETFEKINQYLELKGIFIFDFNTKYRYQKMGASTFSEEKEMATFIWDNYYDEDTCINECQLTLFIKEKKLYRKYQEEHYQRGYTLIEIKKAIEQAGLEFIQAYDDYSDKEVNEKSERICVIARERGK